MKRILLANKFNYPRGGDCVYTIELEKLLKGKGHEVAIFAMQHPNNLPSQWEKHFPSEVDFNKHSKRNIRELIARPLGSHEVKRKFSKLLSDFKPDIVHLNNIHTQLSPILAEIAHKRGIKVIWTLHDYKLLCPRYDCLQNNKKICELCFHNKFNVIRYSCLKGSRAASILAYIEALKWNRQKVEKLVSRFICPSSFINKKMTEGGFNPDKLITLHNFIDLKKVVAKNYSQLESEYYCYIGRISQEKGIETLLEAASHLPYKLKIIGNGPLLNMLLKKYKNENIVFLGHKDWVEIKKIIIDSRFTVIPSECFDNNPITAIESLSLGTPVLGANIGGIPELIQERKNGLLFESGNENDLSEKIKNLFSSDTYALFNHQEIADAARSKYSSENYYHQLMAIYSMS